LVLTTGDGPVGAAGPDASTAGYRVTAAAAARAGRAQVGRVQSGHHCRVSRVALRAAGADVYDETGALIMTGEESDHLHTVSPAQSAGFMLFLAARHRGFVS